jgi:hypothetical protein
MKELEDGHEREIQKIREDSEAREETFSNLTG